MRTFNFSLKKKTCISGEQARMVKKWTRLLHSQQDSGACGAGSERGRKTQGQNYLLARLFRDNTVGDEDMVYLHGLRERVMDIMVIPGFGG